MRDYFCMTCDHAWCDLDYVCCPKCKSKDILDGGESDRDTEIADIDGHYEGDMISRSIENYFQDDTGE